MLENTMPEIELVYVLANGESETITNFFYIRYTSIHIINAIIALKDSCVSYI